ncbi:MAG: hypothetical protein JWQ43_3013 [Glaciihabitans sp.]|nr:hypothetical protein [Glaciihabitans sp.]
MVVAPVCHTGSMPRLSHTLSTAGLAFLLAASVAGCAAPTTDTTGLVATSPGACRPTIVPTDTPDPTEGMTDDERETYFNEFEAGSVWQANAHEIIDAVRTGFPDDFATARMMNPDVGFEVSFAGAAPAAALAIISTATVQYTVVENVGFTEPQWYTLTTEMADAAEDLVTGLSWSAGIDPYSMKMTIDVSLGEDDEAGQATCRRIDPAELADAINTNLATAGVDTYGFTLEVTTRWGGYRLE